MKIYNYDRITKEFIGESTASRDPLEKKEKYLIPANATEKDIIKVKDNFARCFINNKWEYVEDNRDKEYIEDYTSIDIVKKINYIGKIKKEILLSSLEKKEDGTLYKFYNVDGTKDDIKIKEDVLNEFKNKRNSLLLEVDFYQQVLVYNELTTLQKNELKKYRLELLDSTSTQISPSKPTWFR